MILIEETIIRSLILHRASADDRRSLEGSLISDYSEEEGALFKRMFLKPFVTNTSTFEFTHEIGLDYNVLFNLAKSIYEGDDFQEVSTKILHQLTAVSKHPNIKDGDLFVVKFEDVKVNGKYYEGLGIFKFEDKDNFIDTETNGNKVGFRLRKGLGGKKPDKACLIIFTEVPYTILIIDSNPAETDYWQNEFIRHKAKNDNVNSTSNFLSLTKNFITEQIPQGFPVTKADQIDLLNKSVEYFKTHEVFDKKQFEEEVFYDDSIIDSFRKFDQVYREENDIELSDNFEISAQAVKKQARIFKNVLKLDKNFHIYIHGNRELIEQGTDANGRKYYKIYYDEES